MFWPQRIHHSLQECLGNWTQLVLICVLQLLYRILTKRQYTQGLQLKDWQFELHEYNVIIIAAIY